MMAVIERKRPSNIDRRNRAESPSAEGQVIVRHLYRKKVHR
jgi:hypothetical protein